MIPVPASILTQLAASSGISVAGLTHFGGGRGDSDGVVYAYSDHGVTRLLKVLALPPDDIALRCLDERLRFTHFLGEHGASVVFPLPARGGGLYAVERGEGHIWVAYRMDIAPGRTRKNAEWDEPFFRRWGRALATTHRLTQGFEAWDAPADPESGERLLTWQAEWAGFARGCRDEAVRRRWEAIRHELERLPASRDAFGFVHNDPHIQNVVDDGERVTLLDFDVASAHFFASDIAIASQSVLFSHTGGLDRPLTDRPRLRRFLGCFLEGYASELEPPAALARLDLFIAYRRILLFVVMADWLEQHPAVRSAWLKQILEEPELVGVYP